MERIILMRGTAGVPARFWDYISVVKGGEQEKKAREPEYGFVTCPFPVANPKIIEEK